MIVTETIALLLEHRLLGNNNNKYPHKRLAVTNKEKLLTISQKLITSEHLMQTKKERKKVSK